MVMENLANNYMPSFLFCLQCGQCSSICPVSRVEPQFNPRRMIANYLSNKLEIPDLAWLCLDCKLCTEVCPRRLPIDDLMTEMKSKLYLASTGKGYKHARLFTENVSKFGILKEIRLMIKLLDSTSVKDVVLYFRIFFKKKLYR